MNSVLAIVYVLSFALLWLGICTLLGLLSGWYGLMRRYPDRPEAALLTLKNQSGTLGMVGMRGALRLSVCASGLRIGLLRLFGPLSRDFLVPWRSISVSRKDRLLWRTATLDFGPERLTLRSEVVDRMARAAGNYWPEPGHGQNGRTVRLDKRMVGVPIAFKPSPIFTNSYRHS